MTNKRTYSSVADMVRDTSDDQAFADEVASHLEERVIVTNLFGLRNAKGLSQEDIAKKMNCSQSRISKLENGTDAELKLGDFADYLAALGYDAKVVVVRRGSNIVDELKYHVFNIKRIMDRLATLAAGDGSMIRAVLALIKSTAQGIECFLREAANGLTLPQSSANPRLSIEVEDDEEIESDAEAKCDDLVAS